MYTQISKTVYAKDKVLIEFHVSVPELDSDNATNVEVWSCSGVQSEDNDLSPHISNLSLILSAVQGDKPSILKTMNVRLSKYRKSHTFKIRVEDGGSFAVFQKLNFGTKPATVRIKKYGKNYQAIRRIVQNLSIKLGLRKNEDANRIAA